MAEQAPGVHFERVRSGETVEGALVRLAEQLGVATLHARVFGTAAGLSVHALTASGEQCVLDEATVGQIVQADALLDGDGFRCMGVVSVVLHGAPLTFAGRVEVLDALDITLIVQSMGSRAEAMVGAPPVTSAASVERGPRAGGSSAASPASTPQAASGPAPSPWARVAAVSSRVQEDEDEEDECDADDLAKGDILLHPKLGRCRVLMLTGVDAVKVQMPTGSPRKLMLRPFRIYRKGDTREFELRLRA